MTPFGLKTCMSHAKASLVHAGEFAEATRDQFMQERQEYLSALEQAILDATLQSPDCTRDQLAHALMTMDPELPQAQVYHSTVWQKYLNPS